MRYAAKTKDCAVARFWKYFCCADECKVGLGNAAGMDLLALGDVWKVWICRDCLKLSNWLGSSGPQTLFLSAGEPVARDGSGSPHQAAGQCLGGNVLVYPQGNMQPSLYQTSAVLEESCKVQDALQTFILSVQSPPSTHTVLSRFPPEPSKISNPTLLPSLSFPPPFPRSLLCTAMPVVVVERAGGVRLRSFC